MGRASAFMDFTVSISFVAVVESGGNALSVLQVGLPESVCVVFNASRLTGRQLPRSEFRCLNVAPEVYVVRCKWWMGHLWAVNIQFFFAVGVVHLSLSFSVCFSCSFFHLHFSLFSVSY